MDVYELSAKKCHSKATRSLVFALTYAVLAAANLLTAVMVFPESVWQGIASAVIAVFCGAYAWWERWRVLESRADAAMFEHIGALVK